MSKFLEASKIFEVTFDQEYCFNSLEFSFTKSNIIKMIDAKKIPLLFLLGKPGVGKTYMLHSIESELKERREIFFSDEPFATPEAFLHFLLQKEVYDKESSLSALKERAIALFQKRDALIILDEAQLLDAKVLEFIRILADSGAFSFLIAMHEEEGRDIVTKQHFATRDIYSVTLGLLQREEILRYIQFELVEAQLTEIAEYFTTKEAKVLAKLSNGNFRLLKQLLKHTFLIMDYAQKEGHKRYIKPTKCVLTMAALDIGAIDV